MRYADHLLRACLMALLAAIAGCATAPSGRDSTPANAATSAAPVNGAVPATAARDFAAAIGALRTGRLRDAERLLEALTRAHPELSGAHANLGIVYYRSGRLDDAVEALKRAININPAHAAYHNELAIVHRQRGQFERARQAYMSALAADPHYAKAHLNLGILYDLYLRDSEKALHHYGRYQELLPSAQEPVAKWIVDLKQRRPASAAQNAKGGSG